MPVALGVDVGLAKGFDAVAIDGTRAITAGERSASVDELAALIDEVCPDVIAIDAPPAWAAGGRSREIERRLLALGIACFPTPAAEHELPLHGWMRAGFAAFAAAADRGYPLFTGAGGVEHRALEVFPHATAVILRGSLPARRTPKPAWRRPVLEAAGVDTVGLQTLDELDAALAALTGVLALEGSASWIAAGASALVLPGEQLPRARFHRDL